MIADNVTARRDFRDELRALSNVAPNQEERCSRLISIKQVEQLRGNRRIWPIVKSNRQFARRIRAANRGTEELCARIYAPIRDDSRRSDADRGRSNDPGIHGRYCRTSAGQICKCKWLAGQQAASLQIGEQPVDFRIALHAMEPLPNFIGNHLDLCSCHGFAVMYAIFQPVEGGPL